MGAGLIVVFLFLTFGRAKSPQTGPTYARSAPAADPSTLAGIQTGPGPWRAELAHLRERLGALGMPAASGATLHTHEHLDVFVDGNRVTVGDITARHSVLRGVTVPANVGINTNQGFLGPLHTHDDSGVIHVESQTNSVFTLGEFFDVWGVRFTPTCIGGYCAGGGKELKVYVDGHLVRGDPQRVELIAHQEIAVVFGTPAQLPRPIPSSYTFGIGL